MSDKIYHVQNLYDIRGELRGQVRISAIKYRGNYKIHVREYYLTKGGDFLPDKKGVTFDIGEAGTLAHAFGILEADVRLGRIKNEREESGSEAAS